MPIKDGGDAVDELTRTSRKGSPLPSCVVAARELMIREERQCFGPSWGTRWFRARIATAQLNESGRTIAATFHNEDGLAEILTYQSVLTPEGSPSGGSRKASKPSKVRKPSSDKGARRTQASCGSNPDAWSDSGGRWTETTWYFAEGTTPGLSIDTTETYIRNAHIEWYQNQNYCGLPDNSVFSMAYGGRIWDWPIGQDGVNVALFGQCSVFVEIVACAYVHRDPNTGNIDEGDIMLDKYPHEWVNGQAPGKFDTWGAAAHEIGHTLGFGDINEITNVMDDDPQAESVNDEQLGRGDATGNNIKY